MLKTYISHGDKKESKSKDRKKRDRTTKAIRVITYILLSKILIY